ncbi:MAG: SMC-Scp complex subunit ScpB [Acidimicrobiaceae bacterium]|nr:SMC-Scp complex subunit ScpB [Acidimicrobiaceae bacterium]
MKQDLGGDGDFVTDDLPSDEFFESGSGDNPISTKEATDRSNVTQKAIEAILLVSSDPVTSKSIASVLAVSETDVIAEMGHIARFYRSSGRGFELAKIAGGYQLRTSGELGGILERYLNEQLAPRLSGAALEVLAIVAYKQPVSRAQVSAIRGVNSDGVMKMLQARGYLRIIGRDRGPGQAILYGTTQLFLERLGIDSVADLPPLSDFVPSAEVLEAIEASLKEDG